MELDAVVPLLPRGVERLVANRSGNLGPRAVGTASQHDRAGIHGVIARLLLIQFLQPFLHPNFRQGPESPGNTVQPPAKSLVTGQLGEPLQIMRFSKVVNRFPRQ